MESRIIILSLFLFFIMMITMTTSEEQKKKTWRDKNIQDMTDADLEHVLEQWEKDDDPLEPDELPEHLRPLPKIDPSKFDFKKPEDMLKLKKGKNVMMFVDLQPNISEEQAATVTGIWQMGLQNNHITVDRYPIPNNRFIFMFHDGSQAVEAKNYLLEQSEIVSVTIEGQTYYPRLKDGQYFSVDDSLKKPKTKAKNEL